MENHEFMTLDEIIELSQEINRLCLKKNKVSIDEEKNQIAQEISSKLIDMSAQLVCYINNEILNKLVLSNTNIPIIAVVQLFLEEELIELTGKNFKNKKIRDAVKTMLGTQLGTRTMSVDADAFMQGN